MATFKPYSEQKELHSAAPYRSSMLTMPGNLRKALEDAQKDASKTLMGIAQGIPSVFVTKMIASTKPDFIWIDVEHGIFNRLELFEYVHTTGTPRIGNATDIKQCHTCSTTPLRRPFASHRPSTQER